MKKSKVNLKFLSILYKLEKRIHSKVEEMKVLLKGGADTTFKDWATFKIVDCERKDWSKEDKPKVEALAKEAGIEKVSTYYQRVDLTPIPKTDREVDKIVDWLEQSSDSTVEKAASQIGNTSK